MSSIHLSPADARAKIAEGRVPLEDELINGRHWPHSPSEAAVTGIIKHTGHQEFNPNFDYEITEEMATIPEVREPLEQYYSQLYGGEESIPEFDSVYWARVAWQKHGDFLRDVRYGESLLDNKKESLRFSLINASRRQGFPLSPDQITSRLRFAQIGYSHVQNNTQDASGFYHAPSGHAIVKYYKDTTAVDEIATHELFHVLSAHRYVDRQHEMGENEILPVDVSKVGFHMGSDVSSADRGRWMNEAMTQILTQIFLDPRQQYVQFDHLKATLGQIANGVIPEILGLNDTTKEADETYMYTDEKIAFLNAFADIPFKLLVDAYFIQDKDNAAGEGYAGAQAEKELWREIKRRGGTERIKQLREIDTAFESKNPEQARAVALEMKKQNQGFRATLKRGIYSRQVARNTKKVQRGILQARAALDKTA